MRTLSTWVGPRLAAALWLVAVAAPAIAAITAGSAAADYEPLSPQDRADSVPLTDGKGHYILALPLQLDRRQTIFYSPDGKLLYEQDVTNHGGAVGKTWSYYFVDPRHYSMGVYQSYLDFLDGQYSLTCGDRKVPLQVASAPEAKANLIAATIQPTPRKWKPHALARDDRGKYYYVDQGRTKATEKQYRMFVGPPGGMKPQKMTNIIYDSEGEIFATKTGSLRFIVSKKDLIWVNSGKQTNLIPVPVENNLAMIFNDLGVYTGEKMGTPCDDM